jgi:RNA-splicing ligase RtcB
MIIPFNMRDGLAICVGKSNDEWNCSAPHGAGRLMSRSKAKANVDVEEFKKSMEGIYSTSVGKGTLDESPMVYKDYKEILTLIEPTADVLFLIKPKINIKAFESCEEN